MFYWKGEAIWIKFANVKGKKAYNWPKMAKIGPINTFPSLKCFSAFLN